MTKPQKHEPVSRRTQLVHRRIQTRKRLLEAGLDRDEAQTEYARCRIGLDR